MDKVTITLQNKELIESIIGSSKDIEIKVHNAVIDSITKRLIKNVKNASDYDSALRKACEKAEKELKSDFLKEDTSSFYRSYKFNKEYENAISIRIKELWEEEIASKVNDVIQKTIPAYEYQLNEALNAKLKEIESIDVGSIIKKSVQQIMEDKFKK